MSTNNGRLCDLDEHAQAIDLALQLVRLCKKNNYPPDTEICGVAIDAAYLRDAYFIKGKKFERERISSILGINS